MSDSQTPDEKPSIAWSTHPLVERPLTSVGVVLLLGLLLTGVYYWFKSPYWVGVAALFMFLSLSAYFVPTTYGLYDDHIEIKRFLTTQKKKWSDFRKVYPDRNGAFLSPFDSPNRLENFRGIFLRIPGPREEIFRFLLTKVSGASQDDSLAGPKNPESPSTDAAGEN